MAMKRRTPAKGVLDVDAEKRRDMILIAASQLFAQHGFDATSMRDIAKISGILAGSIYHHFKSKAEIFLAAHDAGVAAQREAVIESLRGVTDPWERLSAAAAAHVKVLLEGKPSIFSAPSLPASMSSHRAKVVRTRDSYEKIFADLIAALPLPPTVDRHLFRLHFLGALNWVPQWYKRGGGLTPSQIGQGLVAMVSASSGVKQTRRSETLRREADQLTASSQRR